MRYTRSEGVAFVGIIAVEVRPWAILSNGWTQDAKNDLDKFIVTVASVVPNQKTHPCALVSSSDSQVWFYVCPACADGTLRQWIEGQQVKAMECTPVCQVLPKKQAEGAPREPLIKEGPQWECRARPLGMMIMK